MPLQVTIKQFAGYRCSGCICSIDGVIARWRVWIHLVGAITPDVWPTTVTTSVNVGINLPTDWLMRMIKMGPETQHAVKKITLSCCTSTSTDIWWIYQIYLFNHCLCSQTLTWLVNKKIFLNNTVFILSFLMIFLSYNNLKWFQIQGQREKSTIKTKHIQVLKRLILTLRNIFEEFQHLTSKCFRRGQYFSLGRWKTQTKCLLLSYSGKSQMLFTKCFNHGFVLGWESVEVFLSCLRPSLNNCLYASVLWSKHSGFSFDGS